jgi:putative membrane protein
MARRFIVKIIASAVALWVADAVLAGFSVSDGIRGYLVAGLVLGALNTFIRPLLKLLALPLIFATLGLFTLVINAAILWFVAQSVDAVTLSGFFTLLWATLIVSVINMVFDSTTKS